MKMMEVIENGKTIWAAMLMLFAVVVWAADQRYEIKGETKAYIDDVMSEQATKQRLQVIKDDLDDLESVPEIELTNRERSRLKRRLREREDIIKGN